jgi:tetratricopeptide (TPR) repeat protein
MRSKDGLEKAVGYLQNAIEIDPNYAEAYALLADAYNMLGYYSFADKDEMYDKSRMAAEKAVALDNTLADAYVALAFLPASKRSDKRPSKELIEHAIELSPYNSNARIRYAWMLLSDDVNKTVEQMRLAQQLDPLSPISNGALCNSLILQNNPGDAIKFCEKAVELAAEASENRALLADAYFLVGRTDDAISQIQKRIDEAQGKEKFPAYGSLAYYYARLGRRAEAEKLLEMVKPEAQKDPMLLNDLMVVSYALDKRNDGYAFFQQAYREHVFPYQIYRYSPIWEQARADDRINSFLKASELHSSNIDTKHRTKNAALL